MSQSMSGADWFKHAIIYHILIDRFAGFPSTENWDEPIFLGGNLKGIQNKLEYLKNLGVNGREKVAIMMYQLGKNIYFLLLGAIVNQL